MKIITRFLVITAIVFGPVAARSQEPDGLTHLHSENGELSTTLVETEGKIKVGTIELDSTTYNGDYAGPVLHVHPGDVLRLHLVNHTSLPTNLHFHGMRGSPLGNGDNAHILLQPNASFDYWLGIPVTQPVGLYWYHSHAHHFAERQVMGGLSGTIIVEKPEPSNMTQRLFVLKDMTFEDDTGNPDIDGPLHSVVQSVNGKLLTREAMRPGETQLWRFTNQSANRRLHIALQDHHFRIVGRDGEPVLEEPLVDDLDISPGTRLDVEVASGAPGQYKLLAKGVMTGSGSDRLPDRTIGYLDTTGAPFEGTFDSKPEALPPDLSTAAIGEKRVIVFSQSKADKHGHQDFFINDKKYEEDRMDVRARLGDVEEWTLRNESDDMHAFHIHQIGFQVVEINGKPVPFTGYVDVIRIPERGEVKVRLPFTDPLIVGRFMFHCHVLKHEDNGMMANIEIYDPRPLTLAERVNHLYLHVVWWWYGVPWSQCGLTDA